MRRTISALALIAVLAVGGYVLTRDNESTLTVRGHADDPKAVAEACGHLTDKRVSFSMTADGPVDAGALNVSADVQGDGTASRMADCFTENGATDVGTGPAKKPESFENTGP